MVAALALVSVVAVYWREVINQPGERERKKGRVNVGSHRDTRLTQGIICVAVVVSVGWLVVFVSVCPILSLCHV